MGKTPRYSHPRMRKVLLNQRFKEEFRKKEEQVIEQEKTFVLKLINLQRVSQITPSRIIIPPALC